MKNTEVQRLPRSRGGPMFSLRFILPALVIVVLVALLGYGLTRNPSEIPSALIGRDAPAFEVPRLQQPTQLFTQKMFQGQVSVVNVWASWCVSCRAEHPLMEELAGRTQAKVYGLNYKDERSDALHWLKRYGNPFAAIAYDHKGEVGFNWGVAAVPETFVLDRRGVIRYKQVGPVDQKTLDDTLLPLLKRLEREPS